MGHEAMFISPELVNVWFVAAVPEDMDAIYVFLYQ